MVQNKNNKAIWNTRIKKDTSSIFKKVGSSINVDKRLFKEDIEGSIAHVEMLFKQKIISFKIKNKIIWGLNRIRNEIVKKKFNFNSNLEDIHMNIENRLLEIVGEDAGFNYMKGLHKNISQYTKSGSAGIKASARGEITIGVVFVHGAVKQATKGFPIEAVAPCEGTGYEIGSASIIKGARNLDSAKKFIDFALTADVQSMSAQVKSFQVPSNKNAVSPPEAPDVSSIKLIDYNHALYGSKAERTRLLKKWDKEVKVLPR